MFLGIIGLAVYVVTSMPTKLGLDLKGGVRLVLEAKKAGDQPIDVQTIQGIIQVIQQRINGLGVSEPVVQQKGLKQILVELPGVQDPERAITLIGKTAQLNFIEAEWAPSNLSSLTKEQQEILVGKDAVIASLNNESSNSLVLKRTVLTGNDLSYVGPGTDEFGKPVVQIKFKRSAAETFYKVTKEWQGKPLAIQLDDKVISAPNINAAIGGGEAIIQGGFTVQEMRDLVIQLKAGALPAPVDIISNTIVGPTLGQDSINKSLVAAAIGLGFVMLYMLVFYRLKGFAACVALTLYMLISLATLNLIGATLTLPGIAGFILTIGMAVDANVIIFERIKEHLILGDASSKAIKIGFKKGVRTILDANITTILAAIVLFWLGSGSIKGFAITLSIGIITSMFSALFFSRYLIDLGIKPWKEEA